MRIARVAVPTPDGGDDYRWGVVDTLGGEDAVTVMSGTPFGRFQLIGPPRRLSDVRVLAPVVPSKVVCVGKNYLDHAREMGGEAPETPVIFLKPSTSVIGPDDPIPLPPDSSRVDYEGELAVVIGALTRSVPADQALDHVLGYTCANDVTARDQQQADGQWTRGKGHDGFCPLGPEIVTDLDPDDLALITRLDGREVQSSSTSMLIHDVAELISFVSRVMTLLPGDVLLTGTPAGVGPMVAGQRVEVEIAGIGVLANPVVDR